MNRNSTIGLALFVVLAVVYFARGHRDPAVTLGPSRESEPPPGDAPIARPRSAPPPRPATTSRPVPGPQTVVTNSSRRVVARPAPYPQTRAPRPHAGQMIPFVIEDGLAVAMGDVALGIPQERRAGVTEMRRPDRWPSPIVAYHIQPDLPDPERVMQAFQLFAGTPIRFEPLVDQEDALVFQNGTGACKSYLGRIGGKQPIWLSPTCGPTEIAHEILHALGFIHEQNRADRDQNVRVLMENVEPGNDINFEKLGVDFMGLTGLGEFDFGSIMIYPKTMFGVGGRETLESVRPGVDVAPGRELSPIDRDRLRRAFGRGEAKPAN